MLYRLDGKKLSSVKETGFKKEKELQKFVEDHMSELLGIRYLATEFVIDEHNRVDSVGFDEESNSFVLIEDKNTKDKGLVDQGFAYLAALFDRREKFVLLYNSVCKESRQVEDFDWSQSRIVFISPSFDHRQIDSTSFNDLPFDLYQLKAYGDVISFEQIQNKKKTLTYKDKVRISTGHTNRVLDQITTYTEEDMVPEDSNLRQMYEVIRDRICGLGDVQIYPKKSGIAFKVGTKRFAEICDVNNTSLSLYLIDPKCGLDDENKLCRDVRSYGYGRLVWVVKVTNDSDPDKIMLLVKQSYNDVMSDVS